jgi:hypothetical protein
MVSQEPWDDADSELDHELVSLVNGKQKWTMAYLISP